MPRAISPAPTRSDSNPPRSIANQLLWIQIEDLGIDYVNQRNELIEAVSLDDIKRVAKRLIEADRLITTIVGKPVAAKTQAGPGSSMSLSQSVEGCLEATIGGLGLPQAALDANLAKLEPRLASLREAYAKSHAAAAARAGTARRHRRRARGPAQADPRRDARCCSSAPAARALAARRWPSSAAGAFPATTSTAARRVRARASTTISMRGRSSCSLAGLDLKTSRFIVISKSGGTPETIVQVIAAHGCRAPGGAGRSHPRAVPRRHRARDEGGEQRPARVVRGLLHPDARPRSEYRRPLLRHLPMSGCCRRSRAASTPWRYARALSP